MARKVGELFFEMRATGETLKKDLAEGERQFTKFVEFVKGNPLLAATGLGLAIAGIGLQAAQAAARVDREFGRATKALGATREESDALKKDMIEIAHRTKKTEESIAELFVTIAQGGPGGAANVRAMAEATILLSKVSGLDLREIAEALDQIIDTFGIDPQRAKEIAAVVFSVAQGRAPLADVLAVFGKIGPAAQSVGIDFEHTTAAIVQLLDEGRNVKQAASAFNALAVAGSEGRAQLERLAQGSLTVEEAMTRLDRTMATSSKNIVTETEKMRNELHNYFVDIGRILTDAGVKFAHGLLFGEKATDEYTMGLVATKVAMDDLKGSADEATRSIHGARSAMELLGVTRKSSSGSGLTSGPLFTPFPTQQTHDFGSPSNAPLTNPALLNAAQQLNAIEDQIKRIDKLSVARLQRLQAEVKAILPSAVGTEQESRARELGEKIGDAIAKGIDRKQELAMDRLRDRIRSIGQQIDRTIREYADREQAQKELAKENAAKQRDVANLHEQTRALLQSKSAYEKAVIVQAQKIAIDEAEAKALAAKVPFSNDDRKRIAKQIEDTIKLTKVIAALRDVEWQKVFDIPDTFDRLGEMAATMEQIAAAAANVAAQFGDLGQRIAQLVGTSSQALGAISRMQRAGVYTGTDGKEYNAGFLGALQGKAGLAGTAAAVSSSVAFVGAIAGVADALDLFGNRAREQRRILKERALAFNAALEDFAIVRRTTLEQQLRDNLARASQIAQQAGAKAASFGSAADIDASAESFRLLAQVAPKERAAEFRQLAEEMVRLGKVVRANEATLREQNRTALAQLTEDLAVRRAALDLGKAEGDRQREQLALDREIAGHRERFGDAAEEYIASLTAIVLAERAAAEAIAYRTAVLQRLQDDNDLLGGSAQERLQRGINAIAQAFGEQVAGLFEGLDLSDGAGLEAGRQAIRDLYARLAADGIDESERPLVDFLKRLLGDFDSAIGALPEHLADLTGRLEAFDDRVSLFGISLEEQLGQLQVLLAGRFGDAFDTMLAGLDLGSATSRAESKNRIQQQLAEILGDGVISETERPLYEMLQRLLGLLNQAIDEATQEAERAAAEQTEAAERARAQRAARRQSAQDRNTLFGIEGVEAVRANIDAVGASFSSLFAEFDLDALAGIEGAQSRLRALYDDITALSDEEITRRFGMTRDELLSAILSTNDGLGSLASSLAQVEEEATKAAQAAADLAYRIHQDYLRSQGRGQEADLAQAKRDRDDARQQAIDAGLDESYLAEIDATYDAKVREIAAQYAAAAAKAMEDELRAQQQSSTSDTMRAAADGSRTSTSPTRRTSTTIVSQIGGLSEVTGQTLAGYLRNIDVSTASLLSAFTRHAAAVFQRGLPAPPMSLLAPSTMTATVAGGGPTIVVQSMIVQVTGVRMEGLTPEEAGKLVGQSIKKEFAADARAAARYLGPATRGGLAS